MNPKTRKPYGSIEWGSIIFYEFVIYYNENVYFGQVLNPL